MPGIDGYTKLCLHCDGVDAATSFPDAVGTHTVTAQGDAQVDTDQQVFGTASCLCDGDGDYLSIPDHADWYWPADFTVDFRVRFSAVGRYHGLFQQYVDADNRGGLIYDNASGRLYYYVRDSGSFTVTVYATWSPDADTWYHVAVERFGSAWALYVDGTDVTSSGTPDASVPPDYAAAFWIGRYYNGASYYDLAGWIDEFRVSKGVARYRGAFTPPAAAYAEQPETVPELILRSARPINKVPPHAQVW